MSFIRNFVNQLDLYKLVALAVPLLERKFTAADLAFAIIKDKTQRYEKTKELISLHMQPLLDDPYRPENLQPPDDVNSWDEYVSSNRHLQVNQHSIDFHHKLTEMSDKQIFNEDIQKLKNLFTTWIEASFVRSGLNTAFMYLFSILRVIPMMWKETRNTDITKQELINTLKHRDTKTWLRRNMAINAGVLNVLQNILWQQPVKTKEEATDKINFYENPNALMTLNEFSKMNKLFHPGNFKLTNDGGLDFSESGDFYFEAAKNVFTEKAIGCPAVRPHGEFAPIDALFDHLERVINLIPDERFTKLIQKHNMGYDEIRRGFNQEYAQAEANIAKTEN